jgi:hypothetical protein
MPNNRMDRDGEGQSASRNLHHAARSFATLGSSEWTTSQAR